MDSTFLKEEQIREVMDWVVDTILIPHYLTLNMNATGEWLGSLGVEVEGNKGIIRGRKYTEQLVWGRQPGARPPISALERWAQVKLGLSGREALSAAFAISHKIAKEGTEIYKNGGTDLLEVLTTQENIRLINERIGKFINANIRLEIVRELKTI